MYSGEAVPVGINNTSFARAINDQPSACVGREFTAFVIPKECDNVCYE